MNANKTFHQANLSKWAAIFQEQKASGMTVKDWCAQNNISHHAYYYWKRLAKEAYMESVLPEIVPIALPSADVNASSEAAELPISSNKNSDVSRNLYNSHNSSSIYGSDLPLPPVSAPSEPVKIFVKGVQINIDTTASDDLIVRVIKAVRYA